MSVPSDPPPRNSGLAPAQILPVRPRGRTARVMGALVLREMGSTYGRSPGGYLWALLEPLGTILLLSLGFSLIVRAPSLGTSFLFFYATGYLPFQLFGSMSQKTTMALKQSKALLAYPRVTWIDVIVARGALTLLTDLTVFTILITGIGAVVDTRTDFVPLSVMAGIGIAATLGLGTGLLNSLAFALFPIWQQIWGILTRPLFLASGVFFLYDDMPGPAQDILWWNPLLHATGAVRSGFYPSYDALYVSLPYCYGLSLSLVALGLLLLRRHYKRVLEA